VRAILPYQGGSRGLIAKPLACLILFLAMKAGDVGFASRFIADRFLHRVCATVNVSVSNFYVLRRLTLPRKNEFDQFIANTAAPATVNHLHSGPENRAVFQGLRRLLKWRFHGIAAPTCASTTADRYVAGYCRPNIFDRAMLALLVRVLGSRQIVSEIDHDQISSILFFKIVQLPREIGVLLLSDTSLLVHDAGLRTHNRFLTAINAERSVEYQKSQPRQEQTESGKNDSCFGCAFSLFKLIGFVVAPLSIVGLILGFKMFDHCGELARQGLNRTADQF
jgi:hypothetical protein